MVFADSAKWGLPYADMCSDLGFNWNMKIISQLNQCVFKTDKFSVN